MQDETVVTSTCAGSRKAEVLRDFRAEYGLLAATVLALGLEAAVEEAIDGWSVRDVLAHFAGYHHDMAEAIERFAAGLSPAAVDGLSDDQRNAIYAAEGRGRPFEAVVSGWRAGFEACYAAAASIPEARFLAPGGPAAWLTEETEHYRDHTVAINALVEARSSRL